MQVLRRALCDSPKKPRFIETLPRRGYRFIASVEKVSPASAVSAHDDAAARDRMDAQHLAVPRPDWIGEVATIRAEEGHAHLLLPISEEVFDEMCDSEAAKDDLGISLMVADEKLLLVDSGTRVNTLDATHSTRSCTVRVLGGHFVGKKAFIPRRYLSGLS